MIDADLGVIEARLRRAGLLLPGEYAEFYNQSASNPHADGNALWALAMDKARLARADAEPKPKPTEEP